MELLASLTVLLLFLHGAHGAQWSSGSPPDGLTMFVCSGDTVVFTWQYLLDAGDVVSDTEWLYDGHSQELVAIMSHDHFLPTPAFSQRVQSVGNAAIALSKVVVGDSGNYSVEVNLYDAGGSHVVLRRSVFLVVSADLMTTDGALHAVQSSEAVLDASTGQLAIQLQCGTFRFTDHPPFTVEWTLPSGQKVTSSDYSQGHFNLVLGNPVQGGTYRCTIPPQHTHLACLNANNTHQGQATVVVDKVEARLSLLEKENQQLKQQLVPTNCCNPELSDIKVELSKINATLVLTSSELSNTKADLSNTKADLSNTKADLSNTNTRLQATEAELSKMNHTLVQTTLDLSNTKAELSSTKTLQAELSKVTATLEHTASNHQARLQKLEDVAGYQVAFHATGLASDTPASNTPLVFSYVHYNQGGAYNSANGYFIVPADGVYFFVSSTGPNYYNTGADYFLYVDNTLIDHSYSFTASESYPESSSVHGVMHLRAGQRVWIRSDGNHYYGPSSSFTGFLLFRDF